MNKVCCVSVCVLVQQDLRPEDSMVNSLKLGHHVVGG